MTAHVTRFLDQLEAAHLPAWRGTLRVGEHYGIHLYAGHDGQEPIGTALRPRDADRIVSDSNAVPQLLAAVRAGLAEHRPLVNNGAGDPACPECLGGIYADDPLGARSCGCWGLSTPVCSSCADHHNGRRFALQWPCPTYATVTAALTGGQA